MASILRMPGISADATEATIVEWVVSAGSPLRRGDVIATVETAKAVVELEAEDDGVLHKTLAAPGVAVPVGDPVAVLLRPDETAADADALLASLGLDKAAPAVTKADQAPVAESRAVDVKLEVFSRDGSAHETDAADAAGRIFASPIARRIAKENGVALAQVAGSGPNGRITRRDVERVVRERAGGYASGGAPALVTQSVEPADAAPQRVATSASSFTTVPHSRFRLALAAALVESKREIPHFYVKTTCRVDHLLALRTEINAGGATTKVTINDLFVKAVAQGLAQFPDMNVSWTPEGVRRFDSVDVSVAMASERGLVAPVVRSAQARSLTDISATIKDLAARANAGTLKQTELEGGSFAVSNLGMYGAEEFAAVIPPTRSGILAVGAVTREPVVSDGGQLVSASLVRLVLSVDHRPIDGALAAEWLRRIKELIEEPILLLI